MVAVFSPDPTLDETANPFIRELYEPLALNFGVTDEVELPATPRVLTSLVASFNYVYPPLVFGTDGSVSGQFEVDVFDHQVQHVTKGSSDLIEILTQDHILDVPDNREIFKIIPDLTDPINIIITVTATWDDLTTDQTTYNLEVSNTLSYLGTWIKDYLANRY